MAFGSIQGAGQPVLHVVSPAVCLSTLKTQETHPLNALDAARAVPSDSTGRPITSQCVRTLSILHR